ncbi:MAG: hypothetical protein V2B19_24070 [Pseudomonadota bacterium]
MPLNLAGKHQRRNRSASQWVDILADRLTAFGISGAWTYNANNELVGQGEVSYTYDENGNMPQKSDGDAITGYVYNTDDCLTEVWNGEAGTGSLTTTYCYYPFGRRLWKEVTDVPTPASEEIC